VKRVSVGSARGAAGGLERFSFGQPGGSGDGGDAFAWGQQGFPDQTASMWRSWSVGVFANGGAGNEASDRGTDDAPWWARVSGDGEGGPGQPAARPGISSTPVRLDLRVEELNSSFEELGQSFELDVDGRRMTVSECGGDGADGGDGDDGDLGGFRLSSRLHEISDDDWGAGRAPGRWAGDGSPGAPDAEQRGFDQRMRAAALRMCPEEALAVWEEMRDLQVPPTMLTLNTLLRCCCCCARTGGLSAALAAAAEGAARDMCARGPLCPDLTTEHCLEAMRQRQQARPAPRVGLWDARR